MPYPVKGLLEVYEDMVEILLMLQVFLAEDPEIEYLFLGALLVLRFSVVRSLTIPSYSTATSHCVRTYYLLNVSFLQCTHNYT